MALATLVLAVAAFLINLVPVRASFGLDLLFGHALAMFLVRLTRQPWPVLVALAAALPTYLHWQHLWAVLIMTAEVLWVIWAVRRMNILASDFLYWLVIGIPLLLLTYGYVMQMETEMLLLVTLKQAINGLLYTAIGTLAATILLARLPARFNPQPQPLQTAITEGLLPLIVLPPVLLISLQATSHSDAFLHIGSRWIDAMAMEVAHDLSDDPAYQGRTALPSAMPVAWASRLAPLAPLRLGVQAPDGKILGQWCLPDCTLAPPLEPPPTDQLLLIRKNTRALLPADMPTKMQSWLNLYFHVRVPMPDETGRSLILVKGAGPGVMDNVEALIRSFTLMWLLVGAAVGAGILMARALAQPVAAMVRVLQHVPSPALPRHREEEGSIIELNDATDSLLRTNTRLLDAQHKAQLLAARLERLGQDAPMLLTVWRQDGPAAAPVLDYASARPSARLGMRDGLLDLPFAASAGIHPEDLAELGAKLATLGTTRNLTCEFRVMRNDGVWRWLHCDFVSHPDDAGGAEIVAIMLDVTDQHMARARLEESENLALLGRLSAGLAHELNQPLNIIRLASDNALFKLSPQLSEKDLSHIKSKLERINAQTVRASQIISHMRAFSQQGGDEKAPVDVNMVIENALPLVSAQLTSKGIDVSTFLADRPCQVMGHARQLEQVIVSLLLNARDAIAACAADHRGQISIAVRRDDARRHAMIDIIDNGTGIPSEALRHIFEPFFTLKEPGAGMGLGLSRSYGIVKEHGGDIAVLSSDQGAHFSIRLPLLDKQDRKPPDQRQQKKTP